MKCYILLHRSFSLTLKGAWSVIDLRIFRSSFFIQKQKFYMKICSLWTLLRLIIFSYVVVFDSLNLLHTNIHTPSVFLWCRGLLGFQKASRTSTFPSHPQNNPNAESGASDFLLMKRRNRYHLWRHEHDYFHLNWNNSNS